MPPSGSLHHSEVAASRAERRRVAVRRRLEDLGTTANHAVLHDNPEWSADLEYVWRMRTHEELQRLDVRARTQRRRARAETEPVAKVTLLRSAEWAEHRAQAMALPRAEVVGECGKRGRSVRCGCGTREVPVGCDQVQLCIRCSKVHWRRWRRRIAHAMDGHLRAARGEWSKHRRGKLPGIYLITLTIPHSGSIITDREALGAAWRHLTKIATARQWWGAYALTYEVTPGTDGRGHVHAHVAAVSSWIPYEELHVEWRRVSGAMILDVSAPRSTRHGCAADYLAKYVTKGVDPTVFTGGKAGEILVAMRGKRKVTTSRYFWRPVRDRERVCRVCGKRHVSTGAPSSLRKVAPGPVLRAWAERVGWWIPRGGVQIPIPIRTEAVIA